MGERLQELVDHHLGLSWDVLSTQLGYTTAATLRQAKDGKTLLSAEKLARLACVATSDGTSRVSIDWLLTGIGEPVSPQQPGGRRTADTLGARVQRAPKHVREKIAAYLDVRGKSTD